MADKKSALDSATLIVALLSAICTALLTGANLLFYWNDRKDRKAAESFQAQSTLAKSYFDTFTKMNAVEFCEHQSDALLFGRTSLRLANLDEGKVASQLVLQKMDATSASPDTSTSVKAMAVLIYTDLLGRTKSLCDGRTITTSPSKNNKVVSAVDNSINNQSSYNIQSSSNMDTGSSKPTIWIQYATSSPDAAHAASIRSRLLAAGFNVPEPDAVGRVPDKNQIRVYQRKDISTALMLSKNIGLSDAVVVDLSSTFKQLPKNTYEIWLRDTTQRGQLDFSKPENSALIGLL